MIKIRNNVFETNSSSTHSLVFSKKDRKSEYPLELDAYHQCYDDVENGLLCIKFGEFGWGPAILVDARDKLNYLMTQVANEVIDTYDEDENLSWTEIQEKLLADKKVEHILDIVKFHVPGVKGFKFLRPGEYPDDDEEPEFGYTYPIGYIDHQSWGTANEVEPEELIFNDKILILIDNDNSDTFYDYREHENGIWHEDTKTWEELPKLPPKKDPEELFELRSYDFDYNDR